MTFTTDPIRRQEKILTVADQVPTIPTVANHTLPGWLETDLYKGEWCFNNVDGLWYTRGEAGILGPYATKQQIDELQDDIDTINSKVEEFTHSQSVPSDTWTINHNMNKKPSVTIIDSAGDEVEGNIEYVNNNTLILTFTAGFAGEAYLN